MTDETEQPSQSAPTAWASQADFTRSATRFIRRIFSRLGVEPAFCLVAFPSWKENERAGVLWRSPTLKWDPNPTDWKKEILEAQTEFEKQTGLMWAYESPRAVAFENIADTSLSSHDAAGSTRSFLSRSVSMLSYDVCVALEFDREAYEKLTTVTRPSLTSLVKGTVDVGLLPAVVRAVLDRLVAELSKNSTGTHGTFSIDDVDDVMRKAGDRLMRSLQFTVCNASMQSNLFEQLNAISALRYEGSEPQSELIFAPDDATPLALRFSDPSKLSEFVTARKILQMPDKSLRAFSDSKVIFGLLEGGEADKFRIRFRGHSCWDLRHGENVLAEVRFGIPSLPKPRLQKSNFADTFKRVFNHASDEGMNTIWGLINAALEQAHGAMVAVTSEPQKELERLASQSLPLIPARISAETVFRATAIDGAILLDSEGTCHGIGAILDGQGTSKGDPGRGARFNSAVRYVNDAEERLVIVVSEDGHVNLFPRLRLICLPKSGPNRVTN